MRFLGQGASALLVSLLCAAPGCGGGGGGGASSNTVVLASAFDRTGTFFVLAGFRSVTVVGLDPSIGDYTTSNLDESSRAFLSFGLSAIPPGRAVQSAVLHFKGDAVQGDPFGKLGPLVMDWIDPGALIDNADYAGNTLSAGLATIPTEPVFVGGLAIDVTSAIQVDLANARPASTFRLRFTTARTVDMVDDNATIEFALLDPSAQPQVVVTLAP